MFCISEPSALGHVVSKFCLLADAVARMVVGDKKPPFVRPEKKLRIRLIRPLHRRRVEIIPCLREFLPDLQVFTDSSPKPLLPSCRPATHIGRCRRNPALATLCL